MGAELLTAAQRATLDALCRRMVPAAYDGGGASVDVAQHVESRLAAGDPAVGRPVALLLALFDHPVTGLVTAGRPRRFTRLSGAQQDAVLRAWAESRSGARRTVFQALRRLVLSTYYAVPAAQRDVGYLGPYHLRAPAFPWEGPLQGVETDSEPVARTGLQARGGVGASSGAAPAGRPHDAPDAGTPAGVVQGHDLPAHTTIRAGVCVVGTGAGGAVVAARLAESGHHVVILEEGGYWTAADFTEDEAEMVPRLYAEAGARATADLAVSILQGRTVGGGTTINWLIMLRTPDAVLEEWAAEHGTEGMGPHDMAPVLDLIEEEVHARLVPDDSHSPGNRIILDGARRLGWSARATKINARGCVRAGFCGLGCRYGAKQSTLVTFVPRALAAGARLYSDVRVARVERVERGVRAPLKRVHAEVLDRASGRPRGTLTVEAPVVVVAAGAVGTPVILQRSGMGGGGVGRYLRLHPTSAVFGRYDRTMYGVAGVPQSAICDEFIGRNGGYGFWIENPPLLPALASVAVQGFGRDHREAMEHFPSYGTSIVLVRDGARRHLSSGDVRATRGGRVRIRYSLSGADRAQLVAGIQATARLHLAAGAAEVTTLHSRPCRIRREDDVRMVAGRRHGPNEVALFSAHVNGTCRIGRDPATSGCAPDGQRHGVPGLYVADGSLLPTAPGVNPQQTIMAVATVIARRIGERHRPG